LVKFVKTCVDVKLFVDQIFTQFTTINDTILFPPGYNTAIRANLALRMMPSYGRKDPVLYDMIKKMASISMGAIKGTNMQPPQTAQFDTVLSGHRPDASWIMTGGFL